MILYHYTSNEAFLSIIEGKKLHLSSLNLSNDSQEGVYFFERLKDILFKKLRCKDLEGYEYYLKNFCEDEGAVGFCFSEEGDLLSQWRAYAVDASGISIGFNKERLEELISNNTDEFKGLQLTKIIYSESIEENVPIEKIEQMVRLHELELEENLSELEPNELLKGIQQLSSGKANDFLGFIQDISSIRFQFKNPCFKEEKEWRLFRHIVNLALIADLDEMGFKSKKDIIIPYIEYPDVILPDDIIDEVILGPNNKTPDYIVEMLILKNNFRNVKIKHSKNSYR